MPIGTAMEGGETMPRFPEAWQQLDVALCHDWLTGMRGGEKVLEVLCEGFPKATIYTLIHDAERLSDTVNRHPVKTSFLQKVPAIRARYRNSLPLFPLAIRSLRIPPCDLIISTSHCVAKSAIPRGRTQHLCYCFTPMRYAWALRDAYFRGRPAAGLLARPILASLRAWDRHTAARVNRFVAISRHIEQRITDAYNRQADVVFPPVDLLRFSAPTPATTTAGNYDLVVSALVPYKRVDLAVRAYTQTGTALKVVGTGTEYRALRDAAGPNIEFLGWRTDREIADLYQECRFLLFPGEEDFGIVPVEAQAAGRPVIAYARGGALETVENGRTGLFFDEQTPASLSAAVERAAAMTWDPAHIRRHAEQFSKQAFVDGLAASIEALRQNRPGSQSER